MRRFLVLVSSFILSIFLWTLLVFYRESYVWNRISDQPAKMIILGDSHAEPIDMPKAITMAHGGDPFLMPLLHLKRYLSEVKTSNLSAVVLTVGPHNFSVMPESRLTENAENWLSSNGQRIANSLSIQDYFEPPTSAITARDYLKYEFLLLNKGIQHTPVNWNDKPNLDSGFASMVSSRQRLQGKNWFVAEGVQNQLLLELISVCELHHFELVLLGTPLHQNYLNLVESEGWASYREHLHFIDSMHTSVTYLAFETLNWPDSLFKDASHVNSRGGRILGRMLEDLQK